MVKVIQTGKQKFAVIDSNGWIRLLTHHSGIAKDHAKRIEENEKYDVLDRHKSTTRQSGD